MKLPWQSYDPFLLTRATASAPGLAKELYQATAKKTTKSEKKQRDSKMFLPKPTLPVQNAPRPLLMPSKDWQFGRLLEVLRGVILTWFATLPTISVSLLRLKTLLRAFSTALVESICPESSLSVLASALAPLSCTRSDAKRFKKPGRRLLLAPIQVV
jgi:hypothetical protein